ncbi:MAG: rhodanese-like domain-containing protein [Rhodococcus sp. (in: high G+C Gram-positive bacteria)]
MSSKQMVFYRNKLAYETDSSDLYAALQQEGSRVVVIDGRSRDAFLAEHIPGAINVPHRTMSSATLEGFAKDRRYVTYCDGIGCNASTKAAMNMVELGFDVSELLGGLDWWRRDGYATEGKNAQPATLPSNCGCDG